MAKKIEKSNQVAEKVGSAGGSRKYYGGGDAKPSSGAEPGKRSAVKSVQFRSASTGHYILREASTGKFMINATGQPFKGVVVVKRIQPAPNPTIDKETAEREEKDLIEFINNTTK
ncbi:hypothetical protein [Dyadobacter sp. CY323]|uniref:hypothetical protein n=1 Tax=Dyadobacter sp. CY323 TaxID=2907302 RepID=UPI001F162FC2|nr:hypothetical protein [Dyadobacter sp. CY323]MCE6992924.1 hypothetical protein [Dyadobacter sp. CY323]